MSSPCVRRENIVNASPLHPPPSLAYTPPQASSLCSSLSFPFCSVDVGIWERLHLLDNPLPRAKARVSKPQSCEKFLLSNIEESVESLDNIVFGGVAQPPVVSRVMFSVEKGPGQRRKSASCSQLDLHAGRKHSGARNVLQGGEKIMCVPVRSGPKDSLPVLQVVQTGSMSFSSDEAMLQKTEMRKLPVVADKTVNGGISTSDASGGNEEAISRSNVDSNNQEADIEEEEVDGTRVGLGTLLSAKVSLIQKEEELDSFPVGTWRTAGRVPFKWEEAPGKPKPCADPNPFEAPPALQLPPRLLNRSEIINGSPRNHPSPKRVSSPLAWQCLSPRRLSYPPKKAQSKNLWQSIKAGSSPAHIQDAGASPKSVFKKEEDPWSPISILYGPEAGRDSTSSSSSAADGTSIFSSSSSEIQSQPNVLQSQANAQDGITKDADQSTLQLQFESIVPLSHPFRDSGSHNERRCGTRLKKRVLQGVRILFRRRIVSRELHGKSSRNRSLRENGVWPPHPAADFQSMEADREASVSGLFVFGKFPPEESGTVNSLPTRRCKSLSSSAGFKKETKAQLQLTVGMEVAYAAGEAANQGVCQTPLCSPSSQLRAPHNRSKWKRGKRIWVMRKLRRVSFYLAAMWRALKLPLRGGESKRTTASYENLYR